jgi:putative Flp pilus-assembly TadE/G-like protein
MRPVELYARSVAGNERGAVAVILAMWMPFLLFLFLLVIDVGNWYVHKRHLQMATDAAALAGGAYFGNCFSADPSVAGAADDTIENSARAYSGGSGSTYNVPAATPAGSGITTLFNSKTFAVAGGPAADDTETEGPCETPHLMLDVKQTETNVPYILAGLVSAIVPGADTSIAGINARARVQLKKETIVQGSLPLAVPDVDPHYVSATFVNEATGATVAGPVSLTKGTAVGGLNYWSGSGSVTVPASAQLNGTTIGVRIGMGGQPPTCGSANGTGGNGFVCYDYNATSQGLAVIQGVGSGGSVDTPNPRVWPTTSCTGSPFFSDALIVAPATTCAASIQAVMQTPGGNVGPAQMKTFTVTLNGVTKPMTYDAADGYWTSGFVFNLSPQLGPLGATLNWQSTTGKKAQAYSNIQRVYSALDDSSGPVKALSLSTSTSTVGAPYTLSPGTHSITVNVGIAGSLDLKNQATTVMLRLTGGSRTSAVQCDASGANAFKQDIINGCQTPYQLNPVGFCPDPSPPAGPADCIQTETGDMVGPTEQGLNTRLASCPPVNYPSFDAATDPRVVKLLITDFSALGGSGTTLVPVTNFAAFYITGWTGGCANNDPPPAGLDIKKGAIWGHFVKYIEPDPNSTGDQTCDPLQVTPCVPVLVK